MTVHPGRFSIVTNNYFVTNKIWYNICDCIIKNGRLLINILSQWVLIPSQTSQLLFLYDQSSLEKNARQFSHKKVAKKLLNRSLQKLVGGGSRGEERLGFLSPLLY